MVRGSFKEHDSLRVPLTRRASRVDLSPQAGRGGCVLHRRAKSLDRSGVENLTAGRNCDTRAA